MYKPKNANTFRCRYCVQMIVVRITFVRKVIQFKQRSVKSALVRIFPIIFITTTYKDDYELELLRLLHPICCDFVRSYYIIGRKYIRIYIYYYRYII